MGSVRLGRLPKTQKWQAVVGLLRLGAAEPPEVARATAEAAEEHLRRLASDPSLTYCFWLLTRITWAARSPEFEASLRDLGIAVSPSDSVFAFISRVSDRTRRETAQHPESGPFAELASLALRCALSETVGQFGPSLFGNSVEDFQRACRAYSTNSQFGLLAKRFFGDFVSRTLRFFVDKELSNSVGASPGLSSIAQSREFTDALDTYASQSARIMEDFASGWYSKHNWESRGEISRDEARGFVAIALRKLRGELKREGPQT